jgi:hypothetical protein
MKNLRSASLLSLALTSILTFGCGDVDMDEDLEEGAVDSATSALVEQFISLAGHNTLLSSAPGYPFHVFGGSAHNAVDGDASTYAQSGVETSPFWSVDLGQLYTMSRVHLDLPYGVVGTLHGLQVYVGDFVPDTQVRQYLDGTPIMGAFPARQCTTGPLNASSFFTIGVVCPSDTIGRYLYVINRGENKQVLLSEVRVATTHRGLGGVDMAQGCLQQWGPGVVTELITGPASPGAAYAWRCRVGGASYGANVNQWCAWQHNDAQATARTRNANNAYSWLCLHPN